MTGFAKVLLGLALGLPVGGYAVGSLVLAGADEPSQRAPIILEDAPADRQDTRPGSTLTPSPDRGSQDEDDQTDDQGDDGPEAVVPSYADLDDSHDDDGPDDDSGHGGGDDPSGPGGGDDDGDADRDDDRDDRDDRDDDDERDGDDD